MTNRFHLVFWMVLATPAVVAAQTSVGSHGVRSGDVRIDATGVHLPGTSVTAAGVRTGTAAGGGRILNGNGATRTIACGRGEAVTVNGNGNRLTIVDCRSVTVAGNGNVATVDFATAGRLYVANRNQVTWHGSPRARVAVSAPGNRNVVRRR